MPCLSLPCRRHYAADDDAFDADATPRHFISPMITPSAAIFRRMLPMLPFHFADADAISFTLIY